MSVVAFDALGTLFDLGELKERMAKPLHHAVSLTLAGEWLPLDEIVRAMDSELAEKLRRLDPYPDARAALTKVRADGDRAWILTNGGREQTQHLLERSGLDRLVTEIRSAEEIKKYKPHPDVYGLLSPRSRLVAAHAWDVLGAQAAGYAAVWVNRGKETWPFRGIKEPKIAGSLLDAVRPEIRVSRK